nr:sugar transferase [Carnobacterium inhibens]
MKKQKNVENIDFFSENSATAVSTRVLKAESINSRYIYRLFKRLLDIFGSVIGLFLLSSIFLVVAIIIKKEEKSGSVFFVQTRIGKNGKKFKMYKFRSMCIDAESKLIELLQYNEVDGAMFKIKEDPRITKVGKFIRKTSIDELPQLWNVLKGDMSLVGPRPPLVREVENYSLYDSQRLLVTPGITGLWQVSGRNSLDFKEMVNLDLEYIRRCNITYDLKILLKTFFVVLKLDNAY